MKRLAVLLFIMCVSLSVTVYGAELTVSSPAANPTEEIDTLFSDNKNTNWFVHRLKPKDKKKNKITDKKQPENNSAKDVKTEDTKTQLNSDIKEKDTDFSSKTGKVEKTKENIDKQEEEKRKYRELEELTELNQQAVALYTDNNLDESLNCFSKIPEKMRTPEIWLLMGNILMDKGKKDEAAFMYGRAILTDVSFYKAYYNLGYIYLEDDKFNMAIEQFKLAVKYNINNPYTHYNLGCAYLKAGELKKAKYSFIKAVELRNNVPDFHYNLAYVYKKLGKEKQAKIYLDNYNKLTGQI